MMERNLKTEALVIKTKSLVNKDLLIFLFSKEKGKIAVFGKGVKKITSKRLPILQTANLIKVILTKKDNNYYLKDGKLLSGFLKIKENSKKMKYVYQIFFVLDRILPDNQKEEDVYNLVKSFLIQLSKSEFIDTNFFFNEILKKLGYLRENLNKNQLNNFLYNLINEKIPSFLYND